MKKSRLLGAVRDWPYHVSSSGIMKALVSQLLWLGFVPSQAFASDFFSFTEITSTISGGYFNLGLAGMNNNGDIAFTADFANGSASVYKYLETNSSLNPILTFSDISMLGYPFTIPNPNTAIGIGINDNGAIAYSSNNRDIYSGTGALIADTTLGFTGADINLNGQVAVATASSEVQVTDGVNGTGYNIGLHNTLGGAVVNDNGAAAIAGSFNNNLLIHRLGHKASFPVETITLGSVINNGFGDSQLGFNNLGNISFTTDGGQQTPSTVSMIIGDEARILLDSTDPGFTAFPGNTSLNNWNQAAFTTDGVGTNGIYIINPSGDAPLEVVKQDDVINGSTIASIVGLQTDSMNDDGQVVFLANLFDTTNGNFLAILRADPLVGITPGTPYLPDPNAPGSDFEFDQTTINPGIASPRGWYDPDYATGYTYTLEGGVTFESVLIPAPLPGGDEDFILAFGSEEVSLKAGTPFYFTDLFSEGVVDFSILDIDVAEMLGPTDPEAFVTGLTFLGTSTVDTKMIMSPIVTTVPIPGAVWLFGSGLLGLIGIARRKKTA